MIGQLILLALPLGLLAGLRRWARLWQGRSGEILVAWTGEVLAWYGHVVGLLAFYGLACTMTLPVALAFGTRVAGIMLAILMLCFVMDMLSLVTGLRPIRISWDHLLLSVWRDLFVSLVCVMVVSGGHLDLELLEIVLGSLLSIWFAVGFVHLTWRGWGYLADAGWRWYAARRGRQDDAGMAPESVAA